jgi:hypothetical protein
VHDQQRHGRLLHAAGRCGTTFWGHRRPTVRHDCCSVTTYELHAHTWQSRRGVHRAVSAMVCWRVIESMSFARRYHDAAALSSDRVWCASRPRHNSTPCEIPHETFLQLSTVGALPSDRPLPLMKLYMIGLMQLFEYIIKRITNRMILLSFGHHVSLKLDRNVGK